MTDKTDIPDITPADSRYVPQQQPYCCAPTSIQIVLLRMGLPLRPAEEIGWHLGLVVPPHDAHFFANPRVAEKPPPSGYGTQIGTLGIDPDEAFAKMGLPVSMEIITEDTFENAAAFEDALKVHLEKDEDVLLCLRWHYVLDKTSLVEPVSESAGHVIVVDRIMEDGRVRIVDPARGPKWRVFDFETLFEAIKDHGAQNMAGLWVLRKKKTA